MQSVRVKGAKVQAAKVEHPPTTPRTKSKLPRAFDLKAVKRTTTDNCKLCDTEFTRALGKNPVRHCKRCGCSICTHCSETMRQLSQLDPEIYRVCDKCDTELDNYRLTSNHEKVLQLQTKDLDTLQQAIENLDHARTNEHQTFEQRQQQSRDIVEEMHERNKRQKQELKDLVKQLEGLRE